MRLDVFLKVSRICPRRTVAQKLCDAGAVEINGRPAKPSHSVKAGDELVLRRHDKVSTFRVESIPERSQISREDARDVYRLIREERGSDLF